MKKETNTNNRTEAPWSIYEDADLIVCHKPSGIAVQSARIGQMDMESALNNYLADKKEMVYVVHRLDQPVEGIVVFAKNKKAAASLTSQITKGTMKKQYLAGCDISLQEAAGSADAGQWIHLEDYLVKNNRTNMSSVARKGQKDAKLAVLDYKIVKIDPETKQALVLIDLKTGRHHQIRVQMAHAGMPLIGDRKYHPVSESNDEKITIALCAVQLEFLHPSTGKMMKYVIKSNHPTLNR